jgi:hypothetical protein
MAEKLQELVTVLQKVVVSDKPGNKFKFSNKPKGKHWVCIRCDLDVFFTLAHNGYDPEEHPRIKVMLTLEDTKIHKRADIISDCTPPEGIVVENNSKRPMDLFCKEYAWTSKAVLESDIRSEFMGLLGEVRASLKK